MTEIIAETRELIPKPEQILEGELVDWVREEVEARQGEIQEAIGEKRRPKLLFYSTTEDKRRETLVAIRLKDKDKAEKDWGSQLLGVDVVSYKKKSTKPEETFHLTVDFSQEQPTVSSFSKERKPFAPEKFHERRYRTRHEECLEDALRALKDGVPVNKILEPEEAEKLGITDLLEIREELTGTTPEKFDELTRRAAELGELIEEKPVLAGHVINRLLNEAERSEIRVELLKHPTLEVLTKVWEKHDEIAGQVNRWLAKMLSEQEPDLKGKKLSEHPVMEFLRKRLSKDELVEILADLGLLGRLDPTVLIERSDEASQKVGRLEERERIAKGLKDFSKLVTTVGSAVVIGGLSGYIGFELREKAFLDIANKLIGSGAFVVATGFGASLFLEMSKKDIEIRLANARDIVKILKKTIAEI